MPGQVEPITDLESRSERWVLWAGRRARGRGGSVSIATFALLGVLAGVLAAVQRDSHALLAFAVVTACGLLTFERRVFDRIVRRQAEEIARLRGGRGD